MIIADLNKYDRSRMYAVYDKWPEIARESFASKFDQVQFNNIDHIIFAGMGGSGAIGDIFYSILSKTNIHTSVVKGYLLPKTVDSNTLVVVTSVSGDTIETLTVLDAARKIGSKIVAFSSGGEIQDYCMKHRIEFRNIAQLHSPRASFPRYLYSMLHILNPIIPIEKKDITESIVKLQTLQENINSLNLNDNNEALCLAKWISGIPMIYYPMGLQAAAIRFKNSLQENAKSHAMIEDVIEACHNGIVAWEKPANVKPILIEGKDDFIKTKERWKILRKYFEENNIDYKEIFSVDGSILSKLVNLIYLLDYATIYHTVLAKNDPSPINSIDFVKSKLRMDIS